MELAIFTRLHSVPLRYLSETNCYKATTNQMPSLYLCCSKLNKSFFCRMEFVLGFGAALTMSMLCFYASSTSGKCIGFSCTN